jgi:hypothetical protein
MAEANISILDAAMESTMNVVTRNVIDNTGITITILVGQHL